jgi:hypothetical protein
LAATDVTRVGLMAASETAARDGVLELAEWPEYIGRSWWPVVGLAPGSGPMKVVTATDSVTSSITARWKTRDGRGQGIDAQLLRRSKVSEPF